MAQKILRLRDVIERTGLSRSTVYLKASRPDDDFPAPFKIGLRASGWLAEDIDSWIERRARSSGHAA